METTTIKSWISQNVRIKEEYIKVELELDEDASTYDDDGNVIEEVFYEETYIIGCNNGMSGCLAGKERDVFRVKGSMYGVDLYGQGGEKMSDLPEPSHQIIIDATEYPFIWEAKYFEIVVPVTTTKWVTKTEATTE